MRETITMMWPMTKMSLTPLDNNNDMIRVLILSSDAVNDVTATTCEEAARQINTDRTEMRKQERTFAK